MYCNQCGHELKEQERVCGFCGMVVGVIQRTTAEVSTTAPPAASPAASPTGRGELLGAVAFLTVLAVIFVSQLYLTDGNIGSSLGATSGAVLLAGIVIALYYRRKPVTTRRKLLMLAAWSFVIFLISASGSMQRHKNSDVARLAQEGVGKKAVESPGSEQDQLIRQFFADAKKLTEEYEATLKEIERPSEALTSPASFRDRDTMQRMAEYIEAIRAADEGKEEALARLMDDLRAQVNASGMTAADKNAFLAGLDKGYAGAIGQRRELVAAELAWLDAANKLYAFSIRNSKQFKVNGDKVNIQDADVLATYNRKLENAERLRQEFVNKKKKFEGYRRKVLSGVGLSPEDVGEPGK